jgi:hypothetical protein
MRHEGENQQDFYRSEREALIVGVFERVVDILRSRDRIALTNAREQDADTLNEIRYDLRSMIASAAAVFDNIAVLAHLAFPFELDPRAGEAAISLRRPAFRRGLKRVGALGIADSASKSLTLLHFIWALRNPIFHRHGLPGYTLHILGSANESQITLSTKQVALLDKLCAQRRETAEQWGLRNRDVNGIDPSVDPWTFAQHLAAATIGAIDRLLTALADDRETPMLKTSWTAEQQRALRRFRWLSGLPSKTSEQSAIRNESSGSI